MHSVENSNINDICFAHVYISRWCSMDKICHLRDLVQAFSYSFSNLIYDIIWYSRALWNASPAVFILNVTTWSMCLFFTAFISCMFLLFLAMLLCYLSIILTFLVILVFFAAWVWCLRLFNKPLWHGLSVFLPCYVLAIL